MSLPSFLLNHLVFQDLNQCLKYDCFPGVLMFLSLWFDFQIVPLCFHVTVTCDTAP